jgi:uncharacterized protein
MIVEPLTIPGPDGGLSGDLTLPHDPRSVLVLAHGAGAGYRHPNMTAISASLARLDIASLRFNFPFTESGRRRVDPPAVAIASLVQAWRSATARLPELPLYLGGHSFGGRMASHAVADGALAPRGLICLSFPLHPAGRPDVRRAAHLAAIRVPMLFLSGTRDALADPGLLARVVGDLSEQNREVRLHWLDDADHGYRARKRQRRDPRSVFDELAQEAAAFMTAIG